jgi:hypothetical protein
MLTLTALDRCDRCGARAYHKATKAGEPSELLFCKHHHREHRDGLLNSYWLIESDESPVEPQPVAAYTE